MEDRCGELNVAKMARAFRHVLSARLALELAIDRAESRVVEAELARLRLFCVHCLRVLDVSHAHALDFVGRQETELDLLDRLDGRTRVRKVEVRHDCDLNYGVSNRKGGVVGWLAMV